MVPKINVYLSDDLAEAVKDAQIPVSSIRMKNSRPFSMRRGPARSHMELKSILLYRRRPIRAMELTSPSFTSLTTTSVM